MKKRLIFLTGIGGDVACAILRCLRDGAPGDALYGGDIKKYTPYMHLMKASVILPAYATEEYWPALTHTLSALKITHFLPTTEPEILIASKHRSWFEEHHIKLLINNDLILHTCTSKYKTAAFLKENGITVPATYWAEEYREELPYPVVAKADYGRGSATLKILRSHEDWVSLPDRENMVIQQYIGDEEHEYTVGVFSDGEEVRSIILKRKLGYGGMSVEAEICANDDIESLAEKTARALRLKGSFNIQLREQDGRYYIFEINPRLSSTSGFRHLMGFQDVVWWMSDVDGQPLPAYRAMPAGTRCLKVTDDVLITPEQKSVPAQELR